MTSLYERYILPHCIRCACGSKSICKQRQKVVPEAEGVVLEVGMGSGENLPHYDSNKVEMVYGLEPSEGMRKLARPALEKSDLHVEWINLPGEEIPLPEQSVDTVLLTYTLCTIPDRPAALSQMKRVLKPSGKLIFCEHGLAPDEDVARWQKRINPIWTRFAGGCRIDMPIVSLIRGAGFEVPEFTEMYLPGTPKTLGYNVWGSAFSRSGH
ncbi:MAG: class I SAM-dependent methyltransferase [Myxococcota bacterium]|nr:class I SAM-dependent methyltransferase [Myxococcota bacterium]